MNIEPELYILQWTLSPAVVGFLRSLGLEPSSWVLHGASFNQVLTAFSVSLQSVSSFKVTAPELEKKDS